jgi:hypothetical protein
MPDICATRSIGVLCVVCSVGAFAARRGTGTAPDTLRWRELTPRAAFDTGYNFPVFVIGSTMWALRSNGNWRSVDGIQWTKSALPALPLNTALQRYLERDGAVYALGTMRGSYLDFTLSTRIQRTRDFRTWETLAESSNLPRRVFYSAATFRGRLWLWAGFDGKQYYNDVWNSVDGVHWSRVVEHAPFTPRTGGSVVVFRGRLYMVGGGVIDGDHEPNLAARSEVWSTIDGIRWEQVVGGQALGGTPVVYRDEIWFVGANRHSSFASGNLVTRDFREVREGRAAWRPRGAAAAWVVGDKLYLTGGKYSEQVRGAPEFHYYNDVWVLEPTRP